MSPGGYDALRSFEQRGGEDGGGGGGGGINGEGVDGSKDAMETLKRLCAQRNRQGGPNLSSPYLRNDPTIGHYSLSEGLMGGGLSLSFTPRGSTFAIDVFLTDSSITIAPIPKLPPSVDVGLTLGSALSANSGSISFSNQFGLLPAHATIEVGAIKRAFISRGIETRIDIRIPGISQHGRYNINVLYDRCGLL